MSYWNFMKILYSMLLTVVLTSYSYSQSYIEINGRDTTHFSYSKELENNKIVITLSSSKKTEICEVDSNYYCRKWVYKHNEKNVSFTANRISDSIYISGSDVGKEFHHSIFAGTEPWLQFWEYGISTMIQNQNTTLNFFSIDANKPNKGALFITKKEDREEISMGAGKELSNRVSITIKGLPPMIFKAKLWFRIGDNTLIKSQMPQGPFVPNTTVEIEN